MTFVHAHIFTAEKETQIKIITYKQYVYVYVRTMHLDSNASDLGGVVDIIRM